MKKRQLTIPTSLLLTGAVWPVVTMAQDDGVRSLDRNQDGYVSIAEADADPLLAEQFARLDTNGDGLLDARELAGKQAENEKQDD